MIVIGFQYQQMDGAINLNQVYFSLYQCYLQTISYFQRLCQFIEHLFLLSYVSRKALKNNQF